MYGSACLLWFCIQKQGCSEVTGCIIEYMPAPTDIPAIKGVDLDGNEIERHSSDDEPFAALAFKIMADPFVGNLLTSVFIPEHVSLVLTC